MNGVGVEGYEEDDERCQELKKVLNFSCVKGITVRDDIETLMEKYIVENKEWTYKVLDPAVFSSKVYQCTRNRSSQTIGLGVAREGFFFDYGHLEMTKEFEFSFWKSLAQEIEKIGYKWKIFTNGLYADYKYAEDLLSYMGLQNQKETYLEKRPTEGKELANIISEFKAIVAPRLHSNILAFSMGVPSIGLVYNDKLKFFGKRINHEERFVEVKNMNVPFVIQRLLKAIKEGCNDVPIEEKTKVVFGLREFINKYSNLCMKNTQKEDVNLPSQQVLIANALGGLNFQYLEMNSSITLLKKYSRGFRWFEVDLKLTKDKKLVCVNGWTPKTFNKLNLAHQSQHNAITYNEFISSQYYEHYPVMDYLILLSNLDKIKDIHLILDARNNQEDQMNTIVDCIVTSLSRGLNIKEVILRTSKIEGLSFNKIRNQVKIMYDIPSYKERLELNLTLDDIDAICNRDEVNYISLRKYVVDQDIVKRLKKHNKKICVFTSNTVSEINKLLNMGVSMVASDYIDVDSFNALMRRDLR